MSGRDLILATTVELILFLSTCKGQKQRSDMSTAHKTECDNRSKFGFIMWVGYLYVYKIVNTNVYFHKHCVSKKTMSVDMKNGIFYFLGNHKWPLNSLLLLCFSKNLTFCIIISYIINYSARNDVCRCPLNNVLVCM